MLDVKDETRHYTLIGPNSYVRWQTHNSLVRTSNSRTFQVLLITFRQVLW